MSPWDLLQLPPAVYDEYLAAVLRRDEQLEEDRVAREQRAEQERLTAEMQRRMGR